MFAFGYIERKEDGEKLIKKLRLQRIQDVREQEKNIVHQRCSIYREAIEEKKNEKRKALRLQKLQQLQAAHDQLAKKWRKSLVDTGDAQRGAQIMAVAAVQEVQIRENTKLVQKEHEVKREKEALRIVIQAAKTIKTVQSQQKERRRAVLDLQASNREDAHKAHEARVAARAAQEKIEAEKFKATAGPIILKQAPAGQSTSSVRTQQTAPIPVHAAVMKHGTTSADVTVVKNSAVTEAVISYKKLFDTVIQEMNNRAKAKARSRVAVKTSALAKKADDLEQEFNILHTLDRSGSRGSRVKNTSAVPPNEESPAVATAFENTFLARQKAETEALDQVTNDSESVMTETTDNTDDSGVRKGVSFAGAEAEDRVAKAKFVEKPLSTKEAVAAMTPAKSTRDPNPPKVSFRSSTNKPVPPVATFVGAPRSARSIIPKAAFMAKKPALSATGAGSAERVYHESLEIARTSAVSDPAPTSMILFSHQSPPPEWQASTGLLLQDDDTSVQFEVISEYGTGDEFSIGSDSKLLSDRAELLNTESVDSLAMDSRVMESHFASHSSEVRVVEEVEVTRRSQMDALYHAVRPMHASAGLDELVVSFSSEEGMSALKSTKGRKANTSWLSESTEHDINERSDSIFSDASSASTRTARHDVLKAEERVDSSPLQLSTETESIASEEYRGGAQMESEMGDFDELQENDEQPFANFYHDFLEHKAIALSTGDKDHHSTTAENASLSYHESESYHQSSSSSSSFSDTEIRHDGEEDEEDDDINWGEGTELDNGYVTTNHTQGEQNQASIQYREYGEPSISVRLMGIDGSAAISTVDSVSFESLFVEDEEDEEDIESDEDSEDTSRQEGGEDEGNREFEFTAQGDAARASPPLLQNLALTNRRVSDDSDSVASPSFTLSDFISKYAEADSIASGSAINSPIRSPLAAGASPSAVLPQSTLSALKKKIGVDTKNEHPLNKDLNIVSSNALRSLHVTTMSAGADDAQAHSRSLRELLGIRDTDRSKLINMNKYKRGSMDREEDSMSSDDVKRKQGRAVHSVADEDDWSSDDDAGTDLVNEIDAMKVRLMKVMEMSAFMEKERGSQGSKASDSLSLSQHPLPPKSSNSSSSSSTHSSSSRDSLSFHALDVGSEIISKASADDMFKNLDVALGHALASSAASTASTVDGLVEQYLQSMSSPISQHLVSRSIGENDMDSSDDSIDGGNLSSLQNIGNQNEDYDDEVLSV